eukprot:GHVN01008857.1.p1 GENE.GHVN01008857.1~~GHVN01008857.1.p1  ORF type:complete len:160 (+),score=26.73 GHVN01008857.1:72-482(+)
MFQGYTVEPSKKVELQPTLGQLLRVTTICLGPATKPQPANKTYVQVTHNNETYNVCCLESGKVENATVDLFFELGDENNKYHLSTKGPGTVHVTGYFEPESGFGAGELDSDDQESDEEGENPAQAIGKKRMLSEYF